MLPSRMVSRELSSKIGQFQHYCFHITRSLQGLIHDGLLTH